MQAAPTGLHRVYPSMQGTHNVASATSALPDGYLPFAVFREQFNLESTSTEQAHEITKNLSDLAKSDLQGAMGLLLAVDAKVVDGLKEFIPQIEKYIRLLAEKLQAGGRVVFFGAGSSGRVGINIAALLAEAFPGYADLIYGIIAGGDSTMMRAKEHFEDSEKAGAEAVSANNISAKDVVFLISASGSAKCNVGFAEGAKKAGADVFYFFNSNKVPKRTNDLFGSGVIPLCVDIGAQAIAGSTRLQAATLAQSCLGALVASALYKASGKDTLAGQYPQQLLANLKVVLRRIEEQFVNMEPFCRIAKEVFSNPDANFRRDKDETKLGYLTFLSVARYMRTVFIDVTEMPPTYFLNPPPREHEDEQMAEYAAFLVGEIHNKHAWKALLGREVHVADEADTQEFLLAKEAEGAHCYSNRPTGKGNFVIGVAKVEDGAIPPRLAGNLYAASKDEAQTGLILLCDEELDDANRATFTNGFNAFLCFDNLPKDEVGLTEALLLKQVLNIMSNMSMVLMNKVIGNLMVDVRPSNQKLLDRVMRLVKMVWKLKYGMSLPYTDEELYIQLIHLVVRQKELGIRLSPVKLMLQMFVLKRSVADLDIVAKTLRDNNDDIDWNGT